MASLKAIHAELKIRVKQLINPDKHLEVLLIAAEPYDVGPGDDVKSVVQLLAALEVKALLAPGEYDVLKNIFTKAKLQQVVEVIKGFERRIQLECGEKKESEIEEPALVKKVVDNRVELVSKINMRDGLYSELLQRKLISPRQKDLWESSGGNAEQVELLLDHIRVQGEAHVTGLYGALLNNRQTAAAKLLML